MSKTSILNKNRRSLTSVSAVDAEIYEYLLQHGKHQPISQAQIVKALGISQSTAFRHLQNMVGQKKPYGQHVYTLIYIDGKYQMLKECKNKSGAALLTERERLELQEEQREANKHNNERRYHCALELAYSKALTQKNAQRITSTVIFYGVTPNKCAVVEKMLKSLFSLDVIYDVVNCAEGLYIILREQDIKSTLEQYYADVCDFYDEVKRIVNEDSERHIKRRRT